GVRPFAVDVLLVRDDLRLDDRGHGRCLQGWVTEVSIMARARGRTSSTRLPRPVAAGDVRPFRTSPARRHAGAMSTPARGARRLARRIVVAGDGSEDSAAAVRAAADLA